MCRSSLLSSSSSSINYPPFTDIPHHFKQTATLLSFIRSERQHLRLRFSHAYHDIILIRSAFVSGGAIKVSVKNVGDGPGVNELS